ncbi:hypothetical protein CK489_39785 [Bradyrhizobium sp. UFLA03-84]|nr:hypothetical protein CK489_39785 [Bradyrhizobium sp. UFLA03-84]
MMLGSFVFHSPLRCDAPTMMRYAHTRREIRHSTMQPTKLLVLFKEVLQRLSCLSDTPHLK